MDAQDIILDEERASFDAVQDAIKQALQENQWHQLSRIVLYLLMDGNSLERLVEIAEMTEVDIPGVSGRRKRGQVYDLISSSPQFLSPVGHVLFTNELNLALQVAGLNTVRPVQSMSPIMWGPRIPEKYIQNERDMEPHVSDTPYFAGTAMDIANNAILIHDRINGNHDTNLRRSQHMVSFMVRGYNCLAALLDKGQVRFQFPIKTIPAQLK